MKGKVLGFDIGNYSLKIAVIVNGSIKQFITEKIPDNTVRDDTVSNFEVMADFIKTVLKDNKIKIKNAALTLSGNAVYTKADAVLPLMTAERLKVNLPYEFRDYLSGDKNDYIYDYMITDCVDDNLHLFAVAAPKSLIRNYQEMFERAGLNLKLIVPEYIGYMNIISTQQEKFGVVRGEKDYAVLDIGDKAIRMHFFTKGKYEITRELDFGCKTMVQAYAEQTGQDLHIARMNIESGQTEGEAADALRESYRVASVHVMRVMNFYNFNNPNNNLDTIFYCGGGAHIKPLLDDVAENCGMKLSPFTDLMGFTDVATPDEIIASPQSYGITLK